MKVILFVASAIVATTAICVWLSSANTTYPIIFAAPASGVMAFFGLLAILKSRHEPTTDESIRSAITGALVVMYMIVVGFGVFTDENYGGMSKIAESLMTSFTSVVGVAVAFYFGSSAYVQGMRDKTKPDANKKDPSASP